LVELLENSDLIMRFAVLQNALDNTAAIRMSGKDMNLASEGVNNELDMLSWNAFNSLLHYVVSVLVLHALENIGLELFHEFGLLISKDMFKSLDSISIRSTLKRY
jgi:hypothetical protein